MPAQPRKSTPARKPSAAVAARREVRAEKGAKAEPLTVKFRGSTFEIPRDRLGSARVFMRLQHLRRFPTVQAEVDVLFELLGQIDSARLIDLCGPGDDIENVYNEFMSAANKASNVPNS
jgi:hypothetical protein